MIKQVLILVGAAATAAGVVTAVTLPGEAQQRTAYILQKYTPPVFDDSYNAGMRIIHVPQARASASTPPKPAPSYRETDDEDIAPPAASTPSQQMPQPRRVLPPAGEAKRTMLNPPKSSLHDGPSPMRPLPRWRGIEKFTELPKPPAPAPVADPVSATIPAASATAAAPPSAN